jgi:hypothetical protein
MSSVVCEVDVALSSGNMFVTHSHEDYARRNAGPLSWTSDGYIQHGPKEVVWFCGSCGDGPNADWRKQCTSCNHGRCGCCTVEETGR